MPIEWILAEIKIGSRENPEFIPDIILGGLGVKSDHATIHLNAPSKYHKQAIYTFIHLCIQRD